NQWGGASGFIRQHPGSKVLGRMYLITYQQFNDVVLQESGFKDRDKLADSLPAPQKIDKIRGFSLKETIPDALYDQVLNIGEQDGHPIFTFTTSNRELPIGAPSVPYLDRIVRGLRETYPNKQESEILAYLTAAAGIQGEVTPEKLRRWMLPPPK